MKILCERCSAQYDLDAHRIPAAGMSMKCPACLHSFVVHREGVVAAEPASPASVVAPAPAEAVGAAEPASLAPATAQPREIELSLGGGEAAMREADEIDLPAPKMAVDRLKGARRAGATAASGRLGAPPIPRPELFSGPDEIDLPAPVMPRARASATEPQQSDLPAPKGGEPQVGLSLDAPELDDLPISPTAPLLDLGGLDVVAPATPKPAPSVDLSGLDVVAPATPKPVAAPSVDLSGLDVVAPVGRRPATEPSLELGGLDLVAPVAPVAGRRSTPLTATERGGATAADARSSARAPDESLALELAPRLELAADSLGTSESSPRQTAGAGRPTLDGAAPAMPASLGLVDELDASDDPALELTDSPLDLSEGSLTAEVLDLTPKAPTMDLTPKAPPRELTPMALRRPVPGGNTPLPMEVEAEAPSGRRRWTRLALAISGVLLLLGGIGVAVGMFTGLGQHLLRGGARPDEVEHKLDAARRLMADDTLPSYRKAIEALQPLESEGEAEALALMAQAHLAAARLGAPSELQRADKLLAKLGADPSAATLPDAEKARALRAAVSGSWAAARTQLRAVLQKAPADAVALVYLGWTELGAGELTAADRAFAKALAAESTRTAALYGEGVAKERLGDRSAAHDLYTRALARSATHFGAAVGAARTGLAPAEAEARITQLVATYRSSLAPKQLAEAWTAIGVLAAGTGRREEAADRLQRALGLDPANTTARVALAGVQCDLGRAAEAVAPLEKLLAAQPQNLEARLLLVRAQILTGAATAAQKTLAPALSAASKQPMVSYWKARTLLAQSKPAREQALAELEAVIAANPRFIPAYVTQSTVLAALGRSEEALQSLRQAQQQANADPVLMTELGDAYLKLGKLPEAEARFRDALAKEPSARAARMALGAALEAQDKLDEARRQYEQIAAEDAKFPGLLERQAQLALRQGRKTEAAALYDRALQATAPSSTLRLAAAALFLDPAVQRFADAAKLAEAVVHDDDRSSQGHLLLAEAQLALGRPDDALAPARRAVTLGDLPEAHLVIGRLMEQLGRLEQAAAEYALARRPPVAAEAALGHARMLVRLGASKDALEELTPLLKETSLRPQVLLALGDCYSDLQQRDRARHSYEEAVRAAPQSGEAAFKLGRAYSDAGRRREAIAQLERALRLAGDKAPYAARAELLLGDAHRDGREDAAAVRAYKRYLELAPSSAPERAEVQQRISRLSGG